MSTLLRETFRYTEYFEQVLRSAGTGKELREHISEQVTQGRRKKWNLPGSKK
jgi:hypothetical protein